MLALACLLLLVRPLRCAGAGALGLLYAALIAGGVLETRLAPAQEGVNLAVAGTVSSIPRSSRGRVRFTFTPDSGAVAAPIQLTWYYPERAPRAGERWTLVVRLKRPHGRANPGGYPRERNLFAGRVSGVGYVRSGELAGPATGLHAWRAGLARELTQRITVDETRGVVVALAVGERSGITHDQWELFRRTGTSHLMAISGMHIGLVAAFCALFGSLAWRMSGALCGRVPARVAGVVLALAGACVYAAMAGFTLPTQRALLMLAVALGAVLLRRRTRPWRVLLLASVAVLLHDPLAPLGAAFWLSFGAVAVIVAAVTDRRRSTRWSAALTTQWAVSLAMLPLGLLWFQQAALVSPLANLLAIPAAMLLVPLVLCGVALLACWPAAAELVLDSAAQGLAVLLRVLNAIGQWEVALLEPGWIPGWGLLLGFVAAALLLLPRGIPGRPLAPFLLLPVLLARPERPAEGELWLTVLDVGQGLAVVARTREHVLVFDTGPSYGAHLDAGAAVVAPFLRARGVRHVDRLVISHSDDDHSGGAGSLLRALPVHEVWSGEEVSLAQPQRRCVRGQSWRWNGVSFRVIGPPAGVRREGNEASCVLRIDSAGASVLLTGDIEAGAETELLASGESLRADVLVAPHHGSESSSTPPFVAAVAPRQVVFATGYRNRWNFPRPRVVARYRRVGSSVWRTDASGAVRVRASTDGLTIQGYRDGAARYFQVRPGM